MNTEQAKKIYFLSDFHLGAPDASSSREREKKIVDFLQEIRNEASAVFIVGDMFDFWYEYRKVVPKGYVRLLGKLAELTDAGIQVHFFVGNHDMWMKDYLQTELNIPVYFEPREFLFSGKKFLIGHGDGLGPGDHGYKAIMDTKCSKRYSGTPFANGCSVCCRPISEWDWPTISAGKAVRLPAARRNIFTGKKKNG